MAEAEQNERTDEDEKDLFDVHRQIVGWLFLFTMVIILVLAGTLWKVYKGVDDSSMLLVVLFAGILGGFVSALRRIYEFQNIFPLPQYRHFIKRSNIYLVIYALIPPLVGAIGAVVLYVGFASEIVTGPLFPSFECGLGEGQCSTLQNILDKWHPAAAQDYAKVVVWGFIAGFSERFVPDILNRLSQEGEAGPKKGMEGGR